MLTYLSSLYSNFMLSLGGSINFVFLALIIGLFVLWLISLENSPYKKAVSGLKRALRFLEAQGNTDAYHLNNKYFKQYLHPYIIEKEENHQEQQFIPSKSKGKILLLSPVDEIIHALPRDDHSNMPSLLTSIGVIGTFLGITLALQDLDTTQAANVDELMKGAMTLISGMKVAFYTSLFGLVAAALSIIILSWRRTRRNGLEQTLHHRLSKMFTEVSATESLLRLASPDKVEADKQSINAAKMMSQAAEAMNKSLSGFNADIIAERVGGAITDTLNNNMLPTFDKMSTSLTDIKEQMKNQNQDVLQTMIQDLKDKVISPMADTVITSTEINTELTNSVNSLKEDLLNLTGSLNTTVEHINTSATHLVEQSQALLQSKNDVMELVEIVGYNKASAFKQLEKIAEHLSGIVSNLDHNYNAMQKTLSSFGDSIATYSHEASQHQKQFFTEYDEHSAQLFNEIREAADTIAASVEVLKSQQEQVNA